MHPFTCNFHLYFWLWRNSECSTPKDASLAYWLFWVEVTWKIANIGKTLILLLFLKKWKWKSLSHVQILWPHGLYSSWNSVGHTGVGNLSLLQGVFPAQGSNPGLPYCRRVLYQLSHREALLKGDKILIWKMSSLGTSLVVQWLRLWTSTAGGAGSIPSQGTKIPHATVCGPPLPPIRCFPYTKESSILMKDKKLRLRECYKKRPW